VIQISRKAAAIAEAGTEFTSDELGKLLAICEPPRKLMQHVAKDCRAVVLRCIKVLSQRRLTLTLDTLLVTFPQH
jgi:hypothetical protein